VSISWFGLARPSGRTATLRRPDELRADRPKCGQRRRVLSDGMPSSLPSSLPSGGSRSVADRKAVDLQACASARSARRDDVVRRHGDAERIQVGANPAGVCNDLTLV